MNSRVRVHAINTDLLSPTLYRPRLSLDLPQLLLSRFLRLLAFTCGLKIITQQYKFEFHSCLLKFSIGSLGVVW